MSASKLHISDDLSLPVDAITQTFAILAKRGVGKTHAASVMAEEMLKLGQPIVVYDPTGAWWGLKSSADGKRAGFPVVIFGGEHADVPLEESAGAMIAQVIVEKRMPAILDCGLMRKGARIQFMTDFCETLYHKNREAIHFFVDEAQTIAPQNLKTMPEAARLLGAMEDIVLQGRRRGLGMTIISPRPAVVNTNLRSACEVIIAMQIVAPHDRKAIQEWVDLHGDDAERATEMMSSLSSMKRGEAWVWSPSWLELFKRVKFRGRETFDSSATPKIGQRIVTPKTLAEIDLEALGAEIKSTVERVKADDPKELRKTIATLRTELSKAQQAKPAPAAKERRVEVPILKDAQIQRLERLEAKLVKGLEEHDARLESFKGVTQPLWHDLNTTRDEMRQHLADVRSAIAQGKAPAGAPQRPPISPTPPTIARQRALISGSAPEFHRHPQKLQRPTHERLAKQTNGDGGTIDGPTRKILASLAWWRAVGVNAPTIAQLAPVAGYAQSGSFDTYLSRAGAAGLIERSSGRVILLPAGEEQAPQVDAPTDVSELHRRILDTLDGPLTRIASALIARNGEAMALDELAEASGYRPSGSFDTYLSRLGSRGLIERSRGIITPTEVLFPPALLETAAA